MLIVRVGSSTKVCKVWFPRISVIGASRSIGQSGLRAVVRYSLRECPLCGTKQHLLCPHYGTCASIPERPLSAHKQTFKSTKSVLLCTMSAFNGTGRSVKLCQLPVCGQGCNSLLNISTSALALEAVIQSDLPSIRIADKAALCSSLSDDRSQLKTDIAISVRTPVAFVHDCITLSLRALL